MHKSDGPRTTGQSDGPYNFCASMHGIYLAHSSLLAMAMAGATRFFHHGMMAYLESNHHIHSIFFGGTYHARYLSSSLLYKKLSLHFVLCVPYVIFVRHNQ